MYVELEDFKTGFYGISINIKPEEIDVFIKQLMHLKENRDQHFHISSDYNGDGGVGDIEINIQEKDQPNNMTISGFPTSPTR